MTKQPWLCQTCGKMTDDPANHCPDLRLGATEREEILMTPDQLDNLERRSKDDHLAKMIVGSEVRALVARCRELEDHLHSYANGQQIAKDEAKAQSDRAERAEARVKELEAERDDVKIKP